MHIFIDVSFCFRFYRLVILNGFFSVEAENVVQKQCHHACVGNRIRSDVVCNIR